MHQQFGIVNEKQLYVKRLGNVALRYLNYVENNIMFSFMYHIQSQMFNPRVSPYDSSQRKTLQSSI